MHVHWTVEVVSVLNRGHQAFQSVPEEKLVCNNQFGRCAAGEYSAALAVHSRLPPEYFLSQGKTIGLHLMIQVL